MKISANVTKTGGIRLNFTEGPLLASPILDPEDVDEIVSELQRLKAVAEAQKERCTTDA